MLHTPVDMAADIPGLAITLDPETMWFVVTPTDGGDHVKRGSLPGCLAFVAREQGWPEEDLVETVQHNKAV